MRKKWALILTTIFSVGMAICLIAALIAAALLLIAFFVGQDRAAVLCAFINQTMLPCIYVVGAVLALLGVVKMYAAGEKNFFVEIFHKKK